MVFGSSTATWRDDCSSGKTLAEGWSEPLRQNAGLSRPRTLAAIHTRPCWSNMALWLLARVSQSFSSSQYAEGCIGLMLAAWPGPSDSGISRSATGIVKKLTLLLFGSRIGMLSVEYSGDPYSGPKAFTVGLRRSDAIRSCR